jgi:hydrogenase accessory protein HypB
LSTKVELPVFLEHKRFILQGSVQGVGFQPFVYSLASENPIENEVNPACLTHWPLGAHNKVCLLSTPEGDDKPVKYPEFFSVSNLILLTKIDLIDRIDFDLDFFCESLRTLNKRAPVFELSSCTGAKLEAWGSWLKDTLDHVLV